MMTKIRSKANARFKYLLSIPVLLLIVAFSLFDVSTVSAFDISNESTFDSKPDTNKPASSEEVFFVVEKMPEYSGGLDKGVRKHIAENLIYPEIAIKHGAEGKIYLQFIVDADGSVQDVKIVRTNISTKDRDEIVVVGYESGEEKNASTPKEAIAALEQEALRVMTTLDKFIPGEQRGKKVKVQFTFPIVFQLQAEPKSK